MRRAPGSGTAPSAPAGVASSGAGGRVHVDREEGDACGGAGERERACSGQMGGGPRAAVGTDAPRSAGRLLPGCWQHRWRRQGRGFPRRRHCGQDGRCQGGARGAKENIRREEGGQGRQGGQEGQGGDEEVMPQPRLPRWRILAALPAPLRFRMSTRALPLHARGPARHCDGCVRACARPGERAGARPRQGALAREVCATRTVESAPTAPRARGRLLAMTHGLYRAHRASWPGARERQARGGAETTVANARLTRNRLYSTRRNSPAHPARISASLLAMRSATEPV